MAQKNIADLTAELLEKITDNTNQENTAARVRAIIQDIIDSSWNQIDHPFSKPGVVAMTYEEIQPAPFGPPLMRTLSDAANGKSFFLLVDTAAGIRLDAPDNLKEGETYTFFLRQAADTGTVELGRSFVSQLGLTMVTGDGNSTIFQAYCHNDGTEESPNLQLYCFPQTDFS